MIHAPLPSGTEIAWLIVSRGSAHGRECVSIPSADGKGVVLIEFRAGTHYEL